MLSMKDNPLMKSMFLITNCGLNSRESVRTSLWQLLLLDLAEEIHGLVRLILGFVGLGYSILAVKEI
jgi:hypothetical protein